MNFITSSRSTPLTTRTTFDQNSESEHLGVIGLHSKHLLNGGLARGQNPTAIYHKLASAYLVLTAVYIQSCCVITLRHILPLFNVYDTFHSSVIVMFLCKCISDSSMYLSVRICTLIIPTHWWPLNYYSLNSWELPSLIVWAYSSADYINDYR